MIPLGVTCQLIPSHQDLSPLVAIPWMLVHKDGIGATPLRMATSVGIMDGGFHGEVFVCVDNNDKKPFIVKQGVSMFQAIPFDGGIVRPDILGVEHYEAACNAEEARYDCQAQAAAPGEPWRDYPGNALRSREFRRAPKMHKERGRPKARRKTIHTPGLYNPFTDKLHHPAHIGKKDKKGSPACVARSCSLKEAETNAKAKQALQKEWDRLRRQGTWDETKVESKRKVLERYRNY